MSEILAEAPVRAKSAAAIVPAITLEDMRDRFRSAAQLLEQASKTDDEEPVNYSGESIRLLHVAAEHATSRWHDERLSAFDLQQGAFTVGALISASRLVPGDFEFEERTGLLEQVIALLRPVASQEEGGAAELGRPLAARPAREGARKKGEMTPAQLVIVLHQIAGRASTLTDLLEVVTDWSASEKAVRDTCAVAAWEQAAVLGAMADEAIGGEVRGGPQAWLYGPNFADAGKAGAA